MTKYRDCDGVEWAFGSELVGRSLLPLPPEDTSELARAIRRQWPDSDPHYWRQVEKRYRCFYVGIPENEAVRAVEAGWSWPGGAMGARVIKKRRYIGPPGNHQ